MDELSLDHITPSLEELQPNHIIKCRQPNCNSTFTNSGAYELHMVRRHRIFRSKSNKQRVYHCPIDVCPYNYTSFKRKYFKSMQYIRQHYYKVHLPKTFICERCKKSYSTEGYLTAHLLKECGKKFICITCGLNYNTIEALLTHIKRKGHIAVKEEPKEHVNKSVKVAIPKIKLKRNCMDQATQTTSTTKRFCDSGVQTDSLLSCVPFTNDLDVINALFRDIETQTELSSDQSATTSSEFFDQMLSQSSNMHTQTCDDLLRELGLSDIQTQTYWPISNSCPNDHDKQYTFNVPSANCSHDDLFVSTETQTSFSQCLVSLNDDNNACESNFSHNLYNTQCTQTGDTLLGDMLDFGYQSSYTQT